MIHENQGSLRAALVFSTERFLPDDLDKKILPVDPFQVLGRDSVGVLVQTGIDKGRSTRPDLKVGICGEHGGEPSSVELHARCARGVSAEPESDCKPPPACLPAAEAAILRLSASAATSPA